MLNSTDYRDLRNGKRYQTLIEHTMSNHDSTEEMANRSSPENVKGEVPESQTLTQETVNEQIRRFIAPLTRQLEELTRLVQGMTTSGHPNFYPRTDIVTSSGRAIPQSDMMTGVGGIDTFSIPQKVQQPNMSSRSNPSNALIATSTETKLRRTAKRNKTSCHF